MKKAINFRLVITICIVCIMSSIFFRFLYDYDNKYSTRNIMSQEGSVMIPDSHDSSSVQSLKITWLVEGWSFYPDQLISPTDLTGYSEPIYIGQYFSFSGFHEDGNPYGTGTYHLRLSGNGNYTMLLPEVFSACIVYVDGKKVSSSGSVMPYETHYIKDLVFSFELHGEKDILIQTTNYSHYYSGITYPPAIGSSEAISRLITIRMLFYGFLIFTSLALTLYAAVVWYGTRRGRTSRENFWLGILGLSFSLRICYPFIHMLGIHDGNISYILEATMTTFSLFCIVHTVSLICLKTGALPERILNGIAGGFVCASFIFATVMTKHLPGFVPLYGQLLYWYKTLIALIMILILIRRFTKRNSGQLLLLLAGLLVYFLSLTYHSFYLGRYEPAYTGWFEEWGIYILFLCFCVRMSFRNMEIIRENRHLNKHLQEEVSRKTESLTKLLEERRMLLSGFAHDLKTPITSITTFTRLVEMDNTHLDEESRQYLDIIRRKTSEIQEQLSTINEFTNIDSRPPVFEPIDLCELLKKFYSGNKPDILVNGISFELVTHGNHPVMISGDSRKLTSVLQNIVFNAVSFTPEGGHIMLSLSRESDFAVVRIKDNGTGISEEDLPHIFDLYFTNRNNGNGLGLFIVKSIITEHKGTVSVHSVPQQGTVFIVRLPLLH